MGVPVVVGFHEDEGAGVYRGAPFQVTVERTPAGLRVNGLFGGAISNFELSTDRINGRVGICGWDVRWNGSVYSGSRGGGTRVEPISVSLPATMAQWSDVEVAGALGLLMNVGGTDGVSTGWRTTRPSSAARPDPALAPYYRLAAIPGPRPGSPRRGAMLPGAGRRARRRPAVDGGKLDGRNIQVAGSAGLGRSRALVACPASPRSGVWARGRRMPRAFIFL